MIVFLSFLYVWCWKSHHINLKNIFKFGLESRSLLWWKCEDFSFYLLLFIFCKASNVSTNKLQSFCVIFDANEGSVDVYNGFPRNIFYFFSFSDIYSECMHHRAFDCLLRSLKVLLLKRYHPWHIYLARKERTNKASNCVCSVVLILSLLNIYFK